MLRYLLFQSFFASQFWVESLNCCPSLNSSKVKSKTPMNFFLVNNPHIIIYVYLSPPSKHFSFPGNPSSDKGFRCFDPLENKVFILVLLFLKRTLSISFPNFSVYVSKHFLIFV